MSEFFSGIEQVKTIVDPMEVEIGGRKLLMVPWVCEENEETFADLIKNSDASVILGHLEIIGFEMYPGYVNEEGLAPEFFERFEFVGSGHLHHKSSAGNIHYFGSPYETTWSDYDDPRGFHILDLDTLELEFIENPNKMFVKIFYDEKKDMEKYDFKKIKEKIVKVIVMNKTKPVKFDEFIEKAIKAGPVDLKVVDDHLNAMKASASDIVASAGDTPTIVNQYINGLNNISEEKRKKVANVFHALYNESLQEG